MTNPIRDPKIEVIRRATVKTQSSMKLEHSEQNPKSRRRKRQRSKCTKAYNEKGQNLFTLKGWQDFAMIISLSLLYILMGGGGGGTSGRKL